MKGPALLGFALVARFAAAADYSTDDLCRAIGETPNSAVGPRDRLFLEKKCACFLDLGCAARGSKTARRLEKALKAREVEERAAREREAAERVEREKREAEERVERERREVEARETRRKEAIEARVRREAKQAAIKPQGDAFWKCLAASRPCEDERRALAAACKSAGIETWDECSTGMPR